MIEFSKVNTRQDIIEMSALATRIMKKHYDPIVGSEVNDYMLAKYQSAEGIESEIDGGAEYYFVKSGKDAVGFVAVDKKEGYLYLSKFYLAEEYRGRGYANRMMEFVKTRAKENGLGCVMLNVNAENVNTVATYRHFGFEVAEEIQRSVGDGYSVHDYVMRCKLN